MKDEEKTRGLLLAENESLRAMFSQLKKAESECRWVEAALRESEERYRRLVESITDYIYTVKVENGRPVSTMHGPGCLAVTGYTSEQYQMYPNLWYEMVYEEDRKAVCEQAESLFSGDAAKPLEHRIIHKDGSVRWIRNTAVPHYDKDGHLISYDGVIVDITERKKAEEALRASREYAGNIIEISMDMIIAVDNDRKITEFNKAAQETFGYALEEVLGKHVDILYADLSEGLKVHDVTLRNGRHLQEVVNRRKNGKLFPCLLSSSILKNAQGDIVGLMGISHDITRRKRDEEALKESFEGLKKAKRDWEATFDAISDPLFIHDGAFRITRANRAYAEAAGLPFDEIIGKPYFEVFPRTEGPFNGCKKALRAQDVVEEEVSVSSINKIFRVRYYPVKDVNGNYLYSVHIMEDITEGKRAAEALRESEEKYRLLVENIPDVAWITDRSGRTSYISSNVEKVYGYIPDEIYAGGEDIWLGRIHTDDVGYVMEAFGKLFTEEKRFDIEYRIKRKDGQWIWLHDRSIATAEKNGLKIAYGLFSDITERKFAEERQKALYDFSQRIVSSLDLDFRLRSVCQAISGMGYKMAWIGTLNEDTKDVIPRVQAGFENGYLSSIKVKFDDSPLGQGPTGRAIKSKRPEVQNHIGTDPRYEPWKKAALERGYRSSAAFPIIDKNKVIAILNVYHTEDEFPQRDVDFLRIFVSQTAAYIKNAQLFEEVKETADRLRQEMEITGHLLMIADSTAQTADIDKLMEHVVHCAHEIAKCDICLSYLWDTETGVFRPGQAYGLSHNLTPQFKTESLDMKIRLVKEAMKKKEPIVVAAPFTGAHAAGIKPAATFGWLPDINAIAVIPLTGRKGPLGMIVGLYGGAGLKPAPTIDERYMKVMRGISHQVSIALDEARLFKESIDRAMELSHKIDTIQVMHEIDRSILSTLESQEILETVVRRVSRVIPSDSVTVALVDKERGGFTYAAGFGVTTIPKGGFVSFGDTDTTEVLETGKPQYVADLTVVREHLRLEKGLMDEGFRSHIRVPLTVKGEVVGALITGSKRPSAFTPENLSTLENLRAQIGVALENARLITDLRELFLGTVKSLSSAIDAKSPWTAGHSERVTKYSLQIGKEMGLSEKELKDLELAGLLHDVGKIGTCEYILDKPDRLTDDETRIMRQHPGKGANILMSIKQLMPIIPAIKHHHEFYDGTGYPDGLLGTAIPLFARILTVADTYDAMGADRPYRKGRSMDVIIAELKRCSGTQFDPKVVEAFLKIAGEGLKTVAS